MEAQFKLSITLKVWSQVWIFSACEINFMDLWIIPSDVSGLVMYVNLVSNKATDLIIKVWIAQDEQALL